MKKVIAVISLLFFIVYMYVATNTPNPTGYYVGKGEKTISYNGEDYLYITSMVDEQLGSKLGIVVSESDYQKKWIRLDIFNWFSVKDEVYRLKEYKEKDYLVVESHPIMESIISLYVNAKQKSIPIRFIPSSIFNEENKLSVQNNVYFFVGSVRDENLIGNKFAGVEIENKSWDIFSVNESANDEWIGLKDGDKYNVYAKKRELLTSIPTELYLELEI